MCTASRAHETILNQNCQVNWVTYTQKSNWVTKKITESHRDHANSSTKLHQDKSNAGQFIYLSPFDRVCDAAIISNRPIEASRHTFFNEFRSFMRCKLRARANNLCFNMNFIRLQFALLCFNLPENHTMAWKLINYAVKPAYSNVSAEPPRSSCALQLPE